MGIGVSLLDLYWKFLFQNCESRYPDMNLIFLKFYHYCSFKILFEKVFGTYVRLNFNHSFSKNESQRHFEFIGDEMFCFKNFIKCKDSKIPKIFIRKVKKSSFVSTRDMDSDCCMSKYWMWAWKLGSEKRIRANDRNSSPMWIHIVNLGVVFII